MPESSVPHAEPDPRERYRHLDAPIPLDQLQTSLDVEPVPEAKDDRYREMEWLLRTVGVA